MSVKAVGEEAFYVKPFGLKALPQEGRRSILLGNLAGFSSKAFFDLDLLCKHLAIIGGSGSGKTTAAAVLVEECLSKKVAVVVFDPSLEWSGFGLSAGASRNSGSNGAGDGKLVVNRVRVSSSDLGKSVIDLFGEGELSCIALDSLSENDYNSFVEKALADVLSEGKAETTELKALLVFEGAYRLSPRFGGRAALALEKACRELRKYGVGIVLVTHSFSDFGAPVLGNVSTEVWMKTSFDSDLQRLTKRYGSEYAAEVLKLKPGEAMVANVDYNYSKPWFIKFRESSLLSRK